MLDAHVARIKKNGPYDRYDPTFWVPHQREVGRMVEFNRLTVTIDDIIHQCGYPESERARLTQQHRRTVQEYLKHYQGPISRPFPIL